MLSSLMEKIVDAYIKLIQGQVHLITKGNKPVGWPSTCVLLGIPISKFNATSKTYVMLKYMNWKERTCGNSHEVDSKPFLHVKSV